MSGKQTVVEHIGFFKKKRILPKKLGQNPLIFEHKEKSLTARILGGTKVCNTLVSTRAGLESMPRVCKRFRDASF